MIINVTAPVYLLMISGAITAIYIFSLPLSGEMYDIDNVQNIRIGLPVEESNECFISSEANMSLRLALVSGVVSLIVTILLIVYNLTQKNSQAWPVVIVWMTSIISFVCQLIVFVVIATRISVWFLSCNNPSKINGACPTTRYEHLRSAITEIEMCYFNPTTLTLKNDESNLFLDCLDTETFNNYHNSFARYDVGAYYSASSLCLRNETNLGNDLSWCFYWGCSKACTPDTYYLNIKWFISDCILLVVILVTYIVVLGEFYIEVDEYKKE